MWWTIFTAADLYIGLIVLDAMAPSMPAEKLGRLRTARKVVLVLLAVSAIVLAVQGAHRLGWIHWVAILRASFPAFCGRSRNIT